METIVQILAREFEKTEEHVGNVVTLLDEGNTVPFIARYRKEMHGTMDDQTIRELADRLTYLRNLEDRKSGQTHARACRADRRGENACRGGGFVSPV